MQTEKRAAVRTKEIESKTNVVASVEFVVRAALHDSVEDDFVHSIAGRIIAERDNRGEEDAGKISASLVQFGEALDHRISAECLGDGISGDISEYWGLIEPSDWPHYVETIRPIYEEEEIGAMLEHADQDEAIFLKFLLASGFRDREVRHVAWRDMDFRNSLVRVTAKPLWGFGPKNWEERAVPLPSALVEQLKTLRQRRNGLPSQLVFPNSRGNPDSENDMIVKRVAERAELNCGQCVTKHGNKCVQGPYCRHFFLRKFRHTFATEHLRHGVDIRTLQSWMGHRDIKSTMVYLKGVQSKDALAKVNAGALARYVA